MVRKKNLNSEIKNPEQTNTESKVCTFPLITLRGLVVSLNSNVQILAAREQSIAAFKTALLSEDAHIVVFCQLNDQDENPGIEDLQKIGVLCKVISGDYRDPETYRCVIRGSVRVKLVDRERGRKSDISYYIRV